MGIARKEGKMGMEDGQRCISRKGKSAGDEIHWYISSSHTYRGIYFHFHFHLIIFFDWN